MRERVAVVRWADDDEICDTICCELVALGREPLPFRFDAALPTQATVVFTFAPYGRFLPIPRQLAAMPLGDRPFFVHWDTENPPDLRIPWWITRGVGAWRSWLGRLSDGPGWQRALLSVPPLSWANARMTSFRYVGDYYYTHGRGWLSLLVNHSQIYTQCYQRHGLPAVFVPWGTAASWHADLGLDRDIDVLWMGKRRNKRRSNLLDQVRAELEARGRRMYVADDVENPFIFGETRTRFLNRARITLNVLTTWYVSTLGHRFHMAAGNRSLVVSEHTLPHCPFYEPGVHYVSAHPKDLAEAILYYLDHEREREAIVENAYRLVTETLTFRHSIEAIMDAVGQQRAALEKRL